jgi:hypothetical protein
MDDKDLYWLIGLLEGEGSFMKGSPSAPNSVKVSIQMTDEDVIERVAKLFGRKYQKIYSKNALHKDSYAVRITGTKAVDLMRKILPHMSKRRQEQITKSLESYDEGYRNKAMNLKAKLSDEVIVDAFARLQTESLRNIARSLDVCHETLRQRFKRMNLYTSVV